MKFNWYSTITQEVCASRSFLMGANTVGIHLDGERPDTLELNLKDLNSLLYRLEEHPKETLDYLRRISTSLAHKP